MKWLYTYLLFAGLSGMCSAQPTAFRWREEKGNKYFGVNLSTSRYCGDLSGRYNVKHLQLGWAAELHGRYRLDEQWCIRADVGVYHISADQRNTILQAANYVSFSSTNFSANVAIQWDIRPVDANLRNIPYLFAGLGTTHLNPKAVLNVENGASYSLPLRQTVKKTYPPWACQFAYGMGFPITLDAVTQLKLEGRYTHVLSDYLDDVSDEYVSKDDVIALSEKQVSNRRVSEVLPPNQVGVMRGNPDKNDGYFLLTLQLVHKFR